MVIHEQSLSSIGFQIKLKTPIQYHLIILEFHVILYEFNLLWFNYLYSTLLCMIWYNFRIFIDLTWTHAYTYFIDMNHAYELMDYDYKFVHVFMKVMIYD